MNRKIIQLGLFLSFCCIQALNWTCTSVLEDIYSRRDVQIRLPFQAEKDSPSDFINFKIFSPSGQTLLTLAYNDGQLQGDPIARNCTLVGDVNTGELTIKPFKNEEGVYRLEKQPFPDGVVSTPQCLAVYILGVPQKPIITSDRIPFVGENLTLTCNSSSTTVPGNHNLSLVFNWRLNNTENPTNQRFKYTFLRRNLIISDVQKGDAYIQFTCNATENITDGYSSNRSNSHINTVYYGPDGVILSPSDLSYTVEENTNVNNITCSADCSPACTVQWSKALQQKLVSENEVLPLGLVSRLFTGVYTCTATNKVSPSRTSKAQVVIEVRYGPDKTLLSPSYQQYTITENGEALPNITCSAECNPGCTFVWTKQRNGEVTTVTHQTVLSIGTPTRYDAAYYSCNSSRGASSTTIGVNVEVLYGPDKANLNVSNTYSIREGEPVGNITCTSDCYPGCSFQWKNNSILMAPGGVIQLGTARRYHAGTYTCTAKNTAWQYNKSSEQSAVIIVRYPPDVKINARNTSVNESPAVLDCIAKGVPSNYSYGKWIQVWPGNQTVSERSGSSRLTLFNLTYEYSGTYKCSVSNGVQDYLTGQESMEESIVLLVKSFPVIIHEAANDANKLVVHTRLHSDVSVDIPYYSNYGTTSIKCYMVSNGSLEQKGGVCVVEKTTATVNLPVFNYTVQTLGEKAIITIKIDQQEDFGFYNVTFTNEIGNAVMTIDVKPEGPPEPPVDLVIDIIRERTVTISWSSGFNGGFNQTFVIQQHTGDGKWQNVAFVNETSKETRMRTTLSGLEHTKQYFVRMFAFNMKGKSNFTETYNYTTLVEVAESTPGVSGAIIGGAVGGGTVCAILVIVGVLFIRRLRIKKGTDTSRLAVNKKGRQKTEEDSSDEDVMVENKMYESAGQVMTQNEPVYNKPTKKAKVNANNTDVYAVVDKPKQKGNQKPSKQKPETKKQLAQGDIYENAPEKSTTGNNTYGNAAFEDNPYENPEGSKPHNTPKKHINQDGLIYADLAFNDQPKGQKKLVIHGLDEMTTYVQVDFNRKAEPLPDSDTEEQSDNKKK